MNSVYLSFGRHGRYGTDSAIEKSSMLEAFLMGKRLKAELSPVATIYHSPIARAVETAKFQSLGMQCNHLLEVEDLAEDTPTFVINKFINQLLCNSEDKVSHYHFVTHLPVIEKLGLPELSAGNVCICSAQNWQ